MDLLWVVVILSNVIVAGVGWALRSLYGELKNLQQLIQKTRETYVREEDLRGLREELTSRFDRIENLLIKHWVQKD